MFDRYTEKARRIIFFARYECSLHGSPTIRGEHLLLGLLRETPDLITRCLKIDPSNLSMQLTIFDQTSNPRISTSVDLPLEEDSKRILARAIEEADRLADSSVRPEHLLLGILREEHGKAANALRSVGAPTAAEVRVAIAASTVTQAQSARHAMSLTSREIPPEPTIKVRLRLPLGVTPHIGETVLLTTATEAGRPYRVVGVLWELSHPSEEQEAQLSGVELLLGAKDPAS